MAIISAFSDSMKKLGAVKFLNPLVFSLFSFAESKLSASVIR